MEYIRKCEVCGKIYCYTDNDLANSKLNSINAKISAVGTIASLMGGGSMITSAYLDSQTNQYGNQVIDHTKCPNCNSTRTHLVEVGDEISPNEMPHEESEEIERVVNYEEAMAEWIKLGIFTKKDIEKEIEKQSKIFEIEDYVPIANDQERADKKQEREVKKKKLLESILEISQEIADIGKSIKNQRKIVEDNKMKILGAGAKAKKDALKKIEELEEVLKKLEISEQKLKEELENEKDFLEKIGLINKEMTSLPNEVEDKVKELERRASIQSENEKFVEIYSQKHVLYSTQPNVEYADMDLYANNEKIIMYKAVKDRRWTIILNDYAILHSFDNPSMGIRGSVDVLEYKYITEIHFEVTDKIAGVYGTKNCESSKINLPSEMKAIKVALKKMQERIKNEKLSNDLKMFLLECEK